MQTDTSANTNTRANRLPNQGSRSNNRTMNPDNNHQQLADWLAAVAEERDKIAFTGLFKFFAPKIQRIAHQQFSSEAQAHEVVQETMSNVWRKAHLYSPQKGAPTTWVYTIMRNVSFDMLRKIKSKKEDNLSEDIWPLVEAESAETDVYADHLQQNQILAHLDKLPENQKQVVKGFYFLEMSQEQLAQHLNLPLGTVKSRLRLALAKLKQQLSDQQVGEHDD
ncbi:sigma-70 family RNA polymerase sigma factor [Thalassotalea litorea]|uniref:Sigma-70 family RNA polymerase sigma factor n=2 Tax=Thalassotalea litorea TaxID=2020715 RepID=A0A5R9ITF0_9GAMM|nr:sigma-70 family RNA polymerase sigma factor [Thalassotalea litorea]TLU67377.1 sigma-70 family RNA polymerase sigma factor [Thalassotalea litorea]